MTEQTQSDAQTDAPMTEDERVAAALAAIADDPIAQQMTALVVMMTERANDIAHETVDTSASDAQLAAMRAIPGHDAPGPIANAIAAIERDRELSLESALKTAEYATRQRFAVILDELSRFGMPTQSAPVKPGRASKASTTATATAITDADGNVYVKNQTPRQAYMLQNASPCGACPISKHVIPQAPATAGDDAVKLPNFRQNATRYLAQMSRADVVAHAECFRALSDAEYSYPQAAGINSYLLAE